MDEFVKRTKQLGLLLLLLGVATYSVVSAHRDANSDFEALEALFFAELLISTEYTGAITQLEDEVANTIPDENYKDLVAPRATSEITRQLIQENTYHYGVSAFVNNVLFNFENREFFQIRDNSIEEVFDLDIAVIPDEDRMAYLNAPRYRVSGATCPRISIDAEVDLLITCFDVGQADDANSSRSLWIADGRPFWNGGDIIADRSELFLYHEGNFIDNKEISS